MHQNPIASKVLIGYFSPTKVSSFQSKLQSVSLGPPITLSEVKAPWKPSTFPLGISSEHASIIDDSIPHSFGDDSLSHLPSLAPYNIFSSTFIYENTLSSMGNLQTEASNSISGTENIHDLTLNQVIQLMIKGVPGLSDDLYTGSCTVGAITSSELKSIDIGFNLIDHSRVQHSPTHDEVWTIQQIYSENSSSFSHSNFLDHCLWTTPRNYTKINRGIALPFYAWPERNSTNWSVLLWTSSTNWIFVFTMDSTQLYYWQSNSRIIYSSKSEESWLAGIKIDLESWRSWWNECGITSVHPKRPPCLVSWIFQNIGAWDYSH